MGELVVLRIELESDTEAGAADVPEECVPGAINAGSARHGDLCAKRERQGSDKGAGVLRRDVRLPAELGNSSSELI